MGKAITPVNYKKPIPRLLFYAFDLSKESVQLAAKETLAGRSIGLWETWLIYPVRSQSMEIILDIFSPANYAEFERVLKGWRVIIKRLSQPLLIWKRVRHWPKINWPSNLTQSGNFGALSKTTARSSHPKQSSLTKSLTPEERQALLLMTPFYFTLTKEESTGPNSQKSPLKLTAGLGKSRYKGCKMKVKRLRQIVSAFYHLLHALSWLVSDRFLGDFPQSLRKTLWNSLPLL